jgi:hypothetical protein
LAREASIQDSPRSLKPREVGVGLVHYLRVSVRSSKENGFGGRCANARRIADQDIKRVEQACFATTTLGGMNEEVWSVVELVYQIGVDDPERDQPIERIVLEE